MAALFDRAYYCLWSLAILAKIKDRYALRNGASQPGTAYSGSFNSAAVYVRHRPETTLLYQIVSIGHSNTILPEILGYGTNHPTHLWDRARRPTNDELTTLLDTLSRRIVRVLERRGLLISDPCLGL